MAQCGLLTSDKEWNTRIDSLNRAKRQLADELSSDEGGIPRPIKNLVRDLEIRAKLPRWDYDEFSCHLIIANSGEVTIRDFMLALVFETPFKVFQLRTDPPYLGDRSQYQEAQTGVPVRFRFLKLEAMGHAIVNPEKKIFPGDREFFPKSRGVIEIPHGRVREQCGCSLSWAIYLDDTPASYGVIDLSGYIEDQYRSTQ